MSINVQVSPQYQGVIEQAGDPQNSPVMTGKFEKYDTLSDRPTAASFGVGQCQIGGTVYVSDGVRWTTVTKLATRTSQLKIATFGPSTADYGNSQSPASSDTTIATAPMPASGHTNITRSLSKVDLAAQYPVAELVTNCGVGGDTLVQMLARDVNGSGSTRRVIDAENSSPDVILFRGTPINDFLGASWPISENAYNTIVANFKLLFNRIINSNALIVVDGCYGYSKGLTGFPADANGNAIRAALIRYNAEIKTWVTGLALENVEFIDNTGFSCDATGAYLPGFTATTDGVHESIYGGLNRAAKEVEIIENYFGKSAKYKHKGANLQINPLFVDTTTNSIGTYPTNYGWNSPVNCTRQNGKIELIEDQQWATMELLVTADGDTGIQILLPYNPLSTGTNPLNISANDLYGFEVDFFIENLTTGIVVGLSDLTMRLRTYDSTNAKSIYFENLPQYSAPATAGFNGKIIQHLSTPKYKFQENSASYGTSSQWYVIFLCKATANEVLKVGFSNPRIVKNPT